MAFAIATACGLQNGVKAGLLTHDRLEVYIDAGLYELSSYDSQRGLRRVRQPSTDGVEGLG
jgi:hypothetical protein